MAIALAAIIHVITTLSVVSLPALDGPPCRKSAELRALNDLTLSGTSSQMLVAFGGKGWKWEEKQGKRHMHDAKSVTMLGDMWSFNLSSRTWRELDDGNGPSGRWKMAFTGVDDNSKMVMEGGCTETSVSFSQDDLWVFTPSFDPAGGKWRKVETSNTPVARRGHVMVANTTHLIMFGGKSDNKLARKAWELIVQNDPSLKYTPGDKCLVDTWAISKAEVLEAARQQPSEDPSEKLGKGKGKGKGKAEMEVRDTGPRWLQGSSFPSGCRWGATGSLLTDSKGQEFLAMFGGRYLEELDKEHQADASYHYYNDLWLYDLKSEQWFEAPAKGKKPPARDHHGATTLNGRLFIYGGRRSERRESESVLADIWSYDIGLGEWTQHIPIGEAPVARYMPGVGSVNMDGVFHLAVFAGETLPGSTKRTTLNDLWVFNPTNSVWSELFASTCSENSQASVTAHGFKFLLAFSLSVTLLIGCGIYAIFEGTSPRAQGREVAVEDGADSRHAYLQM